MRSQQIKLIGLHPLTRRLLDLKRVVRGRVEVSESVAIVETSQFERSVTSRHRLLQNLLIKIGRQKLNLPVHVAGRNGIRNGVGGRSVRCMVGSNEAALGKLHRQ